MKKPNLVFTICLLVAVAWACGNNKQADTTKDTTVSTIPTPNVDTSHPPPAITPTVTITPLAKEDSAFIVEAAKDGMMEVAAGNMAQANASNPRIKSLAAAIVQDHTQAQSELKTLVSGRGIVLPDSLTAAERKHLDAMKKMTGKSFDTHYLQMMSTDHKNDISKFEKQAARVKDEGLKNWTSKTLQLLKTHLDSVQVLAKAKM